MDRPFGIYGPELMAARRACGVSRQRLAEAAGLKVHRVQQIEREERLWEAWEIAVLICTLQGMVQHQVERLSCLRARVTS